MDADESIDVEFLKYEVHLRVEVRHRGRGNSKEPSMSPCKLYALSTCNHCKSCKKLLDECGVEYQSTDVDLLDGEEREKVIEEIKRISSRCVFPTLVIGNEVIVGFKEGEIRSALGLEA
jgi:glutaredoxin-like protein NrdH